MLLSFVGFVKTVLNAVSDAKVKAMCVDFVLAHLYD